MVALEIYRMPLTQICPNQQKSTRLGTNTEGKPDVICNKRKLIRWVQRAYEDIMGDEERDLEAKVNYLQDLLNFIISFTGSN